jgi:hypothetical protein
MKTDKQIENELKLIEVESLVGSLKAIFKGREQLTLDGSELSGIFQVILKLESNVNEVLQAG